MTNWEKRELVKTWCLMIGIALVVFGVGMLCGVCVAGMENFNAMTPVLEATDKVTPRQTDIIETQPTVEIETQPTVKVVYQHTETNPDIPLSDNLQAVTMAMCEKYHAPLALVLAIMERESNFDPDAISPTNDYGIMQINGVNFSYLYSIGIDPLTYEGNIEAGCMYIGMNLDTYGDVSLALMAYNCGPYVAQELWDNGIYSTEYSRAVMDAYVKWQSVTEQN